MKIGIKRDSKKPACTPEQTLIANALVAEPKSSAQLSRELKIGGEKLQKALAGMKKLKVIGEGNGIYSLAPEIANAVQKRREIASDDNFKLKLRVLIEAQSVSKELLEKELGRIEGALRKEPGFTIYDCVLERTVKEEGHYASFLEATLSVKDFRALMRLVVFYGPSSVEVLKPEKYEITADALQDALMDLADTMHAYNNYIVKMMNRAELEEFHNKIYESK